MIKEYLDLKKAAGSGYYSRRILAELGYLLQLFASAEEEVPADVRERLRTLKAQADEAGVVTKDAALEAEAALSHYTERAKSYRLICAGHAHIDMNWQWGTDETVGIVIDTFQTVLNLMEEYPHFTFSQSQAATYAMIETYCPSMLPDIRRRIHEGRWEVTAATWVEADQNMPNTESMLRHLLYSKQYLSKLLAIDAASLDFDFEPDTFGHTVHLPEILRQGGVRYFYYCRGYDCKRAFRWRAPSGAEVLSMCEPGWYHGAIEYEMAEFVPGWCRQNCTDTALKVYGVGDHGGGPTRRDIERIMDMASWPLMPQIRFGRMREAYAALEKNRDRLPVQTGELNFIFPGCYTSQSRLKLANRHGEDHLYDAEALSSMAILAGGKCHNPKGFAEAWKKVLFNQFHDTLPGSCIRESKEAALGSAQEAGAYAIGNANRAMRDLGLMIDTSCYGVRTDACSTAEGGGVGFNCAKSSPMERDYSGTDFGFTVTSRGGGSLRAYTIFNTTQYDRNETVHLTLWDWPLNMNETEIRDAAGRKIAFTPLQPRKEYWRHQFDKISFTANVPAFGYTNYYIMQAETPAYEKPWDEPREDARRDHGYVLENGSIRVRLCPVTLKMTSLFDKKTGRELLAGGAGFRLAEEREDFMSSWVVGEYAKLTDLNESCRVIVTESVLEGAEKWVAYELRFSRSCLKAKVRLSGESSAVRLTLETDFQELGGDGIVPQLQFHVPYAYKPTAIRCDVPGGYTDRQEMAMDMPVLRYVAPVPESGSALCLTSDCKYGVRAWENAVTYSLLRASTVPDKYPEQGVHQIELGLAAAENPSPETLSRIGTVFSHPLYPYSNSLHPGVLPPRKSFLQVKGAEVLALKPAEKGSRVVLRVLNVRGVPQPVKVRSEVQAASLQERPAQDVDLSAPYGIKTLLL